MSDTTDDGWIAVDLDGTLAYYDHWRGADHIGDPIPSMAERVRAWLEAGRSVKIYTARVASTNTAQKESVRAIAAWSKRHFGMILEMTAEKDMHMAELWDDRATQVQTNTGMTLENRIRAQERAEIEERLRAVFSVKMDWSDIEVAIYGGGIP